MADINFGFGCLPISTDFAKSNGFVRLKQVFVCAEYYFNYSKSPFYKNDIIFLDRLMTDCISQIQWTHNFLNDFVILLVIKT